MKRCGKCGRKIDGPCPQCEARDIESARRGAARRVLGLSKGFVRGGAELRRKNYGKGELDLSKLPKEVKKIELVMIMQEMEIWCGFSQDDIGKEIEVSGRAGPRWFYRPLVKIKKKVFYLLPWQVESWVYRAYRKIVPLRVLELVEMVCYVPTANSGIYLVKDVIGRRAVVEKVR